MKGAEEPVNYATARASVTLALVPQHFRVSAGPVQRIKAEMALACHGLEAGSP
jgi:hypothetical protein